MARFFVNQKFFLFVFAPLQAFLICIYWRSMKSLYIDDNLVNDIAGLTTSNIGIEYPTFNDVFQFNAGNSAIVSTSMSNSATDKQPAYLTMYGAHRAEKSFALLPKWLQTYFDWHGEQTRNPSDNTKYVILSCHGEGRPCGGISDRLRPLPFFLLFASLAKRVVCIHWTKPFGLENYLVPPMYAAGRMVDWRCPADVPVHIIPTDYRDRPKESFLPDECFNRRDEDYNLNCLEEILKDMRMMNDTYVFLDINARTHERVNSANNIFQLHTYADKVSLPSQFQFIDLMGDIFRVMFEPVLALTQNINDTMTSLGLKENEYSSVHVRSRYPLKGSQKKIDRQGGLNFRQQKNKLLPVINNAVSCANHMAINSTIYFCSDNHEVVRNAVTRDIPVGGGMQVRPVAIHRDKEPLHSEGDNPKSQISDFFPLFEDLLIMGGGKCVAHGMGSFGAFGAGLSGNQCRTVHRKFNGKPVACPNDRADPSCTHTSKFHEGKILFDSKSVRDKEDLISSLRCDGLR